MLICGTLSAANAANSDAITPQPDSQNSQQMGVEAPAPAERPADAANPEPEPAADAAPAAAPAQPAETAMPTPSSPPVEATSAPTQPPSSPSVEPTIVASGDLLYVPAARYLEANSRALGNFDDADRKTLQQFYASRMGSTLWVTKAGYNDEAKNLIAAFKDADNWGLNSADYKVPDLKAGATGDISPDDLTAAEVKLSLAAMEYARDAHGDRISDPSSQLSSYLDRKPVLLDRRTFLDTLATAPDKGAYLESLHPKQPQFELLRQQLIAWRASAKERESLKVPNGPNLTPGKSQPQIALIRKLLKVPAPTLKPDGTPADDTYYDDALATAVKAYKQNNQIRPATATITSAVRRSLNQVNDVSDTKLIANMEEWRWMPKDLGEFHVEVNIPEFMVRVVKDGEIIHEERIVAGRDRNQTPIFSSPMRTIVAQPRWNVPDSIKIKELLPGLRAGGDPLRRQGLVMERNGRRIDAWDVDWYRADIRNFHIYQPPSGGNALGVVKFLFPNSHAVYLHDTPNKGLFNERVRMFSHGCMRVRNPVKLAEVLLQEDNGWSKSKVDDLIENGPEENEIALTKPIPVHVTYFTARVGNDGKVESFGDVYGHEKRITLALQGRWNEIEKNDEQVVSPEDVPMASGWDDDGGYRRSRGDDYFAYDDYDDRRRHKHSGGFGNFFKQVFGGF
jgi:murein L,D-transpeptidase YcbB/YkuD